MPKRRAPQARTAQMALQLTKQHVMFVRQVLTASLLLQNQPAIVPQDITAATRALDQFLLNQVPSLQTEVHARSVLTVPLALRLPCFVHLAHSATKFAKQARTTASSASAANTVTRLIARNQLRIVPRDTFALLDHRKWNRPMAFAVLVTTVR